MYVERRGDFIGNLSMDFMLNHLSGILMGSSEVERLKVKVAFFVSNFPLNFKF